MAEIAPVNALIVFYSRYGDTEKLALSAGVGAIQARANIRLRRLDGLTEPGETDEQWRGNLARMKMDYVVPREADPAWADVVILVAPCDAPGEVRGYLGALGERGGFGGKLAAPFTSGTNLAGLVSLYSAAASAGFTVVPCEKADSTDAARDFGRRVSEMARALKSIVTNS